MRPMRTVAVIASATTEAALLRTSSPIDGNKAPPRFERRIADVGRIGENRGRLGAVCGMTPHRSRTGDPHPMPIRF